MTYIQGDSKVEGCVFCRAIECPDCEESLIVYRGERAFVILNRYPYTSGHLMVVPYSHKPSLEQLEQETRAELMDLAAKAVSVLKKVYEPQGFNLGMNIGSAAGAGISDHVHLHVVPRWGGDTNFMSTTGDTRVLPESLVDTLRRVMAAWDQE